MGSTCPECGACLVRKRNGPPPKFCSRTCQKRSWNRDHPRVHANRQGQKYVRQPDVPCPYCDALRRAHRNTCGGAECRRLDTNRQQREWFARYRDEHGQSYVAAKGYLERYADRRRAYAEANPWREKYPERARQQDSQRRARKVGAESERFDHSEVFERDKWRCQLCGGRVSRSKEYPDPMSASLDHVVPLSQSGPHTRANCQLAHLRCNIRKNTGGEPQQLALIG